MNCVRIPGSPEHPPIEGRIPDENRIQDETRISDATRISDTTCISDATRQSATARTASAYPFIVPLHMPEAGRNQPRPHADANADTDADTDANTLLGAIPATDRSSYVSPDGNGDTPPAAAPENVEAFQRAFAELSERIAADIIGKPTAIRQLLTVLFAGGHLLLEDEPGTGKTRLARTTAHTIGSTFGRIQFTPDLLPSDVLGVTLYDQSTGTFSWRKGPVFASLVLADEINRASPKTQSALLEVMEEEQITIDGTTYDVPQPFMVIATQNPSGHLGTYALPEAQMDRFMMRISLGHPERESALLILRNASHRKCVETTDSDGFRPPDNQSSGSGSPSSDAPAHASSWMLAMRGIAERVHVDDAIDEYIVRLVEQTRCDSQVASGASMRGALALLRCARVAAAANGRDYVLPDDVMEHVVAVLAHRLALTDEAACAEIRQEDVVRRISEQVPVPSMGGERALP